MRTNVAHLASIRDFYQSESNRWKTELVKADHESLNQLIFPEQDRILEGAAEQLWQLPAPDPRLRGRAIQGH